MKLRSWVPCALEAFGSATGPTADQVVELLDDDPPQLLAEIVVAPGEVARRGLLPTRLGHRAGAGVRRLRVRRDRTGGGGPGGEPRKVTHRHLGVGVVGEPDPV